MKFTNNSSVDSAVLEPLVDSAADILGAYSSKVTLVFSDHPEPDCEVSGGLTQLMSSGKCWIRVEVKKNYNTYPLVDCHVPGLPVELKSLREEILFILSHEFQHANQFFAYHSGLVPELPDDFFLEFDAEVMAINKLTHYRYLLAKVTEEAAIKAA